MRVAIDATHLGSGRGGDDTYMRGLLRGLAEVVPDGGEDVFPLYLRSDVPLPEAVVGRAAFPTRSLPWGPVAFRHAVSVPYRVLRERPPADLVYTHLYGPPISPAPHVVNVTDASFYRHPELYPIGTRLRLNIIIPFLVRRARAVVTCSEYSRQDLIEAFGLAPERVFVVYPAVVVSARESQPLQPCETPYFLYLGNLHPRKNVPRLIQAFARARQACPDLSNHTLVIAGGHWYSDTEEERAARDAPPGSIQFVGPVDDAERDRLLAGAHALAFPSLFEGFGLPPLEAMAAGTPVLASKVTSLPEVLGDAALLVDPLAVDSIAAGLVRLGTDPALRRELRCRGVAQAARYTPRATGQAILEAFRRAAAVG